MGGQHTLPQCGAWACEPLSTAPSTMMSKHACASARCSHALQQEAVDCSPHLAPLLGASPRALHRRDDLLLVNHILDPGEVAGQEVLLRDRRVALGSGAGRAVSGSAGATRQGRGRLTRLYGGNMRWAPVPHAWRSGLPHPAAAPSLHFVCSPGRSCCPPCSHTSPQTAEEGAGFQGPGRANPSMAAAHYAGRQPAKGTALMVTPSARTILIVVSAG